jgi:proline iminopeptidase
MSKDGAEPKSSGFRYNDPGVARRFGLEVGEGHTLNVELCGSDVGHPIIYCHGGPGGLIAAHVRRYGDPERIRLIQFDQRGCGASVPAGETLANNTDRLVEDMERIREALGLERWTIAGGSWGATLALNYAQAYPQRVQGIILRGAFLGDEVGFRWFDETMRHIFPDAFDLFAKETGCGPNESLYDAAARHVLGSDREMAVRAALALTLYEERCASFEPADETTFAFDPDACLSGIRIALHYRTHQAFLPVDGIASGMHRLANIPGIIIHGRYDIVCPFGNAIKLHSRWPGSKLVLCPRSGHLGTEPELAAAMTAAFEEATHWSNR